MQQKRSILLRKAGAIMLAMSLILAVSCNNDETDETGGSRRPQVEEPDTTADEVRYQVSDSDLPVLEAYIEKLSNGPFREYSNFPDFTNVSQIPPVVLAGNHLLYDATRPVGLTRLSRNSYEQFLQSALNPGVTLPANANYQLAYDANSENFSNAYEMEERNFRPYSIWLDAEVSQEGNDIYFDAYELSYEFVNQSTGRDERNNPIARMVVDDVTIGFAAPIAHRDLHLIDHRPLAKTRYTIRRTGDGWHLISKTKLRRNESYKTSATEQFAEVTAQLGTAINLSSGRLNVRDWASTNASILGTLHEGTTVWYVNCLPGTGFVLGAPAARGAVFNYQLGYGFMSAEFIG